MKTLNVTFEDDKYLKMERIKSKTSLSWRDFLYEMVIDGNRRDN